MTPQQIRHYRAVMLHAFLKEHGQNIEYRPAMEMLGMQFPRERFEFGYVLGEVFDLDIARGVTRASQSVCRFVIEKKTGRPSTGFLGKARSEQISLN